MKTKYQVEAMMKGKQRQAIDFSQFHEAIGDDFPEITSDRIGRFRLQQFLRGKLGAGYMNTGLGKRIFGLFDAHMKLNGGA